MQSFFIFTTYLQYWIIENLFIWQNRVLLIKHTCFECRKSLLLCNIKISIWIKEKTLSEKYCSICKLTYRCKICLNKNSLFSSFCTSRYRFASISISSCPVKRWQIWSRRLYNSLLSSESNCVMSFFVIQNMVSL